ncbi:hypothetical protein O1L44_04190 [Streptomyces noursei]|nr:hypothetical protein [Streptomyces noursei]
MLLTMDTAGGAGYGRSPVVELLAPGPLARSDRPDHPAAPDGPIVIAVYNPQAHPEFTTDAGLLLSYDVNWLGPPGAPADPVVNGDVELYRPRFLRVRLAPTGP